MTRDYGAQVLVERDVADPPKGQTVLRLLDAEAEIETRYGGGFVHSIEGVAGTVSGGRSFDWFFYVNGVESPLGAAEVTVEPGDRVWWDYRDWTDAMRVPAVVGSWPQPFAPGAPGPVLVECAGTGPICDRVRDALAAAGARARLAAPGEAGGERPAVLVGAWRRIAAQPAAELLAAGPARSGVFVAVDGRGRPTALDASGSPAGEYPNAGLVAATRSGDDEPVWVVTGPAPRALAAAAAALDPAALANRYAVLVPPGAPPVPLPAGADA